MSKISKKFPMSVDMYGEETSMYSLSERHHDMHEHMMEDLEDAVDEITGDDTDDGIDDRMSIKEAAQAILAEIERIKLSEERIKQQVVESEESLKSRVDAATSVVVDEID